MESSTFCYWLLISILLGRSSSSNISLAFPVLVNCNFIFVFCLFNSSICCLVFLVTLLLVSLTAVFIIINICSVIHAVAATVYYRIHRKLLIWLHFDLQHHCYHLHMYMTLLLIDATTLCATKNVQEGIEKKSFNNRTKYLFPLIRFADIDFLFIQNLSEYY